MGLNCDKDSKFFISSLCRETCPVANRCRKWLNRNQFGHIYAACQEKISWSLAMNKVAESA